MSDQPLDAAGRGRLPATLPQFDAGRGPRDKGSATRSAPIEGSIAVEGWRCSSVGSALEVAISIAPALSLESRAWSTGRRIRGHAHDRRSARYGR